MVRVVVLNWNSAWFSRRCLAALARTEHPADRLEVVLVDNASVDGSLERLSAAFPDVRIVRNEANLGFAEGCNRAMRDLAGVDHVALVNNDAVPEPGWLTPLVEALERDPRAGAAASLLVLEPAFTVLDLEVERGEALLASVGVGALDVLDRCLMTGVRSVGRPEWPMTLDHHVDGHARLLVPVGDGPRTLSVTASGVGCLTVRTEAGEARLELGTEPRTVELAAGSDREERVNGLGTDVTDVGEGFDRHYGAAVHDVTDPDGTVVPGFCGGGVLLRARMLEQVGLFDPRFFAYYEDTDLSWRARRSGWRTVAAPGSVIRHAFGGSAGSKAKGFFFLNYRNWLLTVLRNGDREQRRRALGRYRERLTWAVRANVAARLRRGRRPDLLLVGEWLRVAVGVAGSRLRSRALAASGRSELPGAQPCSAVRSRWQPAPAHRAPGSRPGGPLVVYVELDQLQPSGVASRLAAELAEVEPRIDAVALRRSDTAGSGFRRATPREWAALVGLDPATALDVEVTSLDLDELDPAAVLLSATDGRSAMALDGAPVAEVARALLARFGTP